MALISALRIREAPWGALLWGDTARWQERGVPGGSGCPIRWVSAGPPLGPSHRVRPSVWVSQADTAPCRDQGPALQSGPRGRFVGRPRDPQTTRLPSHVLLGVPQSVRAAGCPGSSVLLRRSAGPRPGLTAQLTHQSLGGHPGRVQLVSNRAVDTQAQVFGQEFNVTWDTFVGPNPWTAR